MKNLLTLIVVLLFFPFSLISQWTSSEGGNQFDGKYKTSSIQGKGDTFPYKTPTLVINKFDNSGLNFYLNGAGFFQPKTGLSILFAFDNSEKVYSVYDWSLSDDGKIIFFSKFNNIEKNKPKLSNYDIISLLKTYSKVSFRIKDNFSSNNLEFSLTGSSKAISYVLPNLEELVLLEKQKRNEIEKRNESNKIVFDKLINILEKDGLDSSSMQLLESKIERDLGLGIWVEYASGDKYTSIQVIGDAESSLFNNYGYVDVFYVLENGEKQQISGSWKVNDNSPVKERAKMELAEAKQRELEAKQRELEKEKENEEILNKLLSKFKIEKLVTHFRKEIEDKQKYSPIKFDFLNIQDIQTVFSDFRYGKFWEAKIIITLNTSEKIEIKSYIYDLDINKKGLKSIGAKANTIF